MYFCRSLAIAPLFAVVLVGCSPSGLGSGTSWDDLGNAEYETFCDWSIAEMGGENVEKDCGDDVTVTSGTKDECVAELSSYVDCDLTVGDLEDCKIAVAEDPCGLGGEACATAFDCSFAK